jgi:hypothetical protein
MKSIVTCGLLAAVLSGLTLAAASADTTPPAAEMASLVCRPAASGEKPSALTTGQVALVCKPLDMKPFMAMKAAMLGTPAGELLWLNAYNAMHIDHTNNY